MKCGSYLKKARETKRFSLLSRHGIIFQEHHKGEGSAAINDPYLRDMKELFEQLLKENDSRIALLEENLARLKKI